MIEKERLMNCSKVKKTNEEQQLNAMCDPGLNLDKKFVSFAIKNINGTIET